MAPTVRRPFLQMLAHEAHALRARTDEAHIAPGDIDHLRQFVDMCATKSLS